MNHRFADARLLLKLALGGEAVADLQLSCEDLLLHFADKQLLAGGDLNDTNGHMVTGPTKQRSGRSFLRNDTKLGNCQDVIFDLIKSIY